MNSQSGGMILTLSLISFYTFESLVAFTASVSGPIYSLFVYQACCLWSCIQPACLSSIKHVVSSFAHAAVSFNHSG